MRTRTSHVLLGAGAFSLALAGLGSTVLQPALLKAPRSEELVSHATGAARKLDPATGQLQPVQLAYSRTVQPHVVEGAVAGDDDTAVYDMATVLALAGPDGQPVLTDAQGRFAGLKATQSTVAFDRSTGEGRPGVAGDTYGTTAQTVKFPFGTERRTYSFFDSSAGRAVDVAYTGTTKVDGLEVYRFEGSVPETETGQYGLLEGTIGLYSNPSLQLMVEPVTGKIVEALSSPQTSIRMPSGQVEQALLVDQLRPTDETVREAVAAARDAKSKALLVQRAPWALGLLGAALVGLSVLVRRRRPAPVATAPQYGDSVPEPRDGARETALTAHRR